MENCARRIRFVLEPLERRRLLSGVVAGAPVDDAPPTAEVSVAVVREAAESFFFDVTYRDESAIEVKPAEHTLRLEGEDDGGSAIAVGADAAADGRSVTIRYEAKRFYGWWGNYDNGVWTIEAAPRAIRDVHGNVLRAVPIGQFRVAIPLRGRIDGKVLLDELPGADPGAKPKGVSGVRVFADEDGDGRFDAGEPSATSGADGKYSVDGVKPGWARIVLEAPNGYVNTSDHDRHDVRITRYASWHTRRNFQLVQKLDGLHVAAGTSGDDVIEVFKKDGSFRVRLNDKPVERVADDAIEIRVYGRGGDDRIVIGGGRGALPNVFGGAGDDTLLGSSGPDMLDGGEGSDHIDGGAGDDWLVGGTNSDSIFARAGDDVVHGGRGHDVLRGDAGDDTFVANESGEKDTIAGGAGRDEAFVDRRAGGCDGWMNLVCWDGWRDDLSEVEKVRWRRD